MYMMTQGEKPTGECYLIPPDDNGVAWLVAHYYDGSNVKLIRFKKPEGSPVGNSPMQRMYDLEDNQLKLAQVLVKAKGIIMALTGFDIDSGGDLPKVISDLTSIKGARDGLNDTGDAQYLVTNVEQLSNKRGW